MVPRHNGVRGNRYKLMHFYVFDEWEFYDLETDPDELHNLYEDASYASQILESKKELERLRNHYEDESVGGAKPVEWQRNVRGLSPES